MMFIGCVVFDLPNVLTLTQHSKFGRNKDLDDVRFDTRILGSHGRSQQSLFVVRISRRLAEHIIIIIIIIIISGCA